MKASRLSRLSTRRTARLARLTAALAAALVGSHSAQATTKTWNPASTDFNDTANWTGGLPGISDVATFTGIFGTAPNLFQPGLTGVISISGLNFSSTTTSGYDLTTDDGVNHTLTLLSTATGATGAINAANTTGTNTIDTALVLGTVGAQTITGATGGTLVINGVISGVGTLTKAGGGILKLTGANTYTGGTTLVTGGIVHINNNTALGTGSVTIAGTIDNSSGGLITLTNNNLLSLGTAFTFTGSNALNLGNGNITMAATSAVTTTASTLTMGGIIGATSAGLTKSGAGTLVLSNAGTQLYTGTTTVSAGTLQVDGILSSTAVSIVGTLRVSNVNALASAAVTGTSAGAAILQLRNDTNNATFATSGALTISGTGLTVNVDQAIGGTGTGNTLKLGAINIITTGALNATGANGYSLAVGAVTVGTAATSTVQASSANLTLDSLTGLSSGVATTVTLSAVTANGIITGAVTDGNTGAGKTLALTKTNAGSWTLQGANTYTGATLISAGVLQIDGTLGGTAVNIGAGTLRLTNGSALGSAASLINSMATSILQLVNDSDTNFLTPAMTLPNSIVIDASQATGAGAGKTLSLSGNVSLGAATITTTSAAGGDTVGLGAVSTTGATAGLTSTSGAVTVASITGASGGATTVTLGGVANGTVTGAIADNGASTVALSKAGTGTWILTGNNTYSGTTTVPTASGVLQIGNGGTAGTLGSNANATVTGTGVLSFKRSDAINVSTNLLGTGIVQQGGSGSLTLSAAGNAFSGGLNIISGKVIAGNANANVIGTGTVTMANGTTLDLNGNSPITGLLSTSGNGAGVSITNNAVNTPSTLTLSPASGTATFAGTISDGAGTSTVSLTKATAGTQILSGASTYSGVTNVTGGALNIQNATALGSTAGGTAVASGASLQLQGGITVAGEALGLTTAADTIQLRNIIGDNTWTGNISATLGNIMRLQSDSGLLTLGNIATSGTFQLVFQGLDSTHFGAITVNGVISGNAPVTHGNNSGLVLTLAGANTYTGTTSISNGTITITGSLDPTTGSAVNVGSTTAGTSSTLNLNAAGAITRNVVSVGVASGLPAAMTENTANALSGSAALTVTTNGTATLSQSNNYTGATTLNSATGTLHLTTAGAISGSVLTYAAGTLDLAVANALSGTAGLTLNGPNLTLSLANNYTGTTTLSAGTMSLALDGAIGTGQLVLGGGVLQGSGAGTRTIGNATTVSAGNGTVAGTQDILFTGTFTQNNAAVRTLTVNNTGNTTLSGNVFLSNAAGTGRVLTIAGTGAITISGSITDGPAAPGGLTYTGTNVLTLSGTNNTFTGATTITGNGATVTALSNAKIGTGALTVSNTNTTLAGNATTLNLNSAQSVGTLTGAISTPLSGTNTLTINLTGAGTILTVAQTGAATYAGVLAGSGGLALAGTSNNTLTLTGANTYSGTTSINGGTVQLNSVGSIANSSAITLSSGTLTEDNSGSAPAYLTDDGVTTFGRIGNSTSLTLRNGKFNLMGSSTGGNTTVEKIGAVTLDSGASVFKLTQGVAAGTSTMLAADSLTRSNRGTTEIIGTSLGQGLSSTNIALFRLGTGGTDLVGGGGAFTSGTATNISIVPYLVGDASATAPATGSFVGYDTTNDSYRVLKTNEYAVATGGSATDNVRFSTATTATITGATVNSLVLNNSSATVATTYTLNGTLTPTSGAVLFTSNGTSAHSQTLAAGTSGLLDFGSIEGIISTTAGGVGVTATLGVQITGSNGVTLSTFSTGSLTLGSAANNYSGTTTINGLVKLGGTGVIPDASNVSVSAGGTLDTATFSETIGALSGAGTVDNSAAGTPTLTIGDGSGTFSGVIKNTAGTLAIEKRGAGTQTLSGANTYTGATTVTAGTVVVSGSISGTTVVNVGDGINAATLIANGTVGNSAVVTVNNLATLKGISTISGSVTVQSGGTVAPGGSTGILTVTNGLTLASGAHLSLEIGGTTAGFNTNGTDGYDRLVVNSGNVSLAGDLGGSTLTFAPASNVDIFYVILNNGGGTTTGTLNGVAEGGSVVIGGQQFQISYTSDFGGAGFTVGGSGNDVALMAIPEPDTAVSLLGGLGMLLGLRRRRSANKLAAL